MKRFFPILNWLPNYKREYFSGDLAAGLTVGVMLIPQGMAYAMIAGLPPVYGLYASIFPQIIYAIFGTSRQLAVGPVAMDSLLVAAGVSTIATIGSENYIALAILLSFMMGVVQLVFGIFRLGFLVNFLSRPVISGFTSAAALIIGLNQLKHIIGIDIERNNNIFIILFDAIKQVSEINVPTLLLGVGGIILIKLVKKIHKSIPGALVVVILGVLLVSLFGLDQMGVKIVGDVPNGLPSFSIPDIGSEHFGELIPVALTLALIAFMESISVSKALQAKHKGEYEIDNNQEMIGLGMGNIIGSLFASYPTTGGFSRSAVNDQAGAKTNLAAIIAAGLVALTLLFLTPLFYFLPKAVLGSIIMVAVFGLIDFQYPIRLWKINKEDFVMLSVTFIVTLSFGIKEGIGAGVLVSLIYLIYRTTRPHIAVLGKLPNSKDYRNIKRFKEIEVRKDVLIVRHDSQLFFANISNFLDELNKQIIGKGSGLKLVVLHCGSVSNIDSTALQSISELIIDLQKKDIKVALSGVIGPVRDFLHKSGFIKDFGTDRFFIDVQSAIDCFDDCDKLNDKSLLNYAVQSNVFKEKDI